MTDPDGDPVTYEIQVDDDADFSSPLSLSPSESGLGTSYTPSTALTASDPGTTYYWRVRSSDGALQSAFSSSRRVVVSTLGIWAIQPMSVSVLQNSAFDATFTITNLNTSNRTCYVFPTSGVSGLTATVDSSPNGGSTWAADLGISNTVRLWRNTSSNSGDQQQGQTLVFTIHATSGAAASTILWPSMIGYFGAGSGFSYNSVSELCSTAGSSSSSSYAPRISYTVTANQAPPAPAPTSPADLAVTSDTTPDLAWSPVTDPEGDPVTYQVEIDDNSDFSSPLVLSPPATGLSGTSYTPSGALPDGTYSWHVLASDGLAASAYSTARQFTVDTTAPVVTPPGDVTVEATGPSGATATFGAATALDAVDGPVAATCDATSGDLFALGDTTVTCSATDSVGNTGSASFTVTVTDTTAPVVTVPADVTVEATGPSGAPATFADATALDVVDGPLAATCDHLSGDTFPVGVTTVTCSATDAVREHRDGVVHGDGDGHDGSGRHGPRRRRRRGDGSVGCGGVLRGRDGARRRGRCDRGDV